MLSTSPASRRAVRAAAFALFLAPALVPAATDFSKVIPQDAVFAAWTNDFPALKSGLESSPYGRFWNDPAADKLRAFVQGKIDAAEKELFEKEGTNAGEMLSAFSGGVAIYGRPAGDVIELEELPFVLLVETDEKGREWFSSRMKKLADGNANAKKDSYEVNGVTVYRIASPEGSSTDAEGNTTTTAGETISYAFAGKHFVLTNAADEAFAKDAFNRVASPSAGIGSREDGRHHAGAKSDGQLNGFFDMGRVIKSAMEQNKPAADADPNQQMMYNGLPKTGALDFGALYLTLTPAASGIAADGTLTMAKEKNGIVKGLFDGGTTPLATLPWAPANATGVTSFGLDLGALYDGIIATATALNPGIAGMAQMQLGAMQGQYGVDVVNSIVKNIAGEHLVVQRPFSDEVKKSVDSSDPTAAQNSTVTYLGLKNGNDVVGALKTLVDNLKKDPSFGSAIEVAEVEGVTTVSMKSGDADASPLRPSLAFSPKAIVFSNNSVELQEAIRSLAGKNASPITGDGNFQKAAGSVDKNGLRMFSFTPASAMAQALDQVRKLAEMGIFGDAAEGLTPDMIPDGKVAEKYFGDSTSAVYFKDEAVTFRAFGASK